MGTNVIETCFLVEENHFSVGVFGGGEVVVGGHVIEEVFFTNLVEERLESRGKQRFVMQFVQVLLLLVDPLSQNDNGDSLVFAFKNLTVKGIQILSMNKVQIQGVNKLPGVEDFCH